MLGTVAVAGKQADGSQQPPGSGQPGGQVAPVPGYPGYYIATPTGSYNISYEEYDNLFCIPELKL